MIDGMWIAQSGRALLSSPYFSHAPVIWAEKKCETATAVKFGLDLTCPASAIWAVVATALLCLIAFNNANMNIQVGNVFRYAHLMSRRYHWPGRKQRTSKRTPRSLHHPYMRPCLHLWTMMPLVHQCARSMMASFNVQNKTTLLNNLILR